MAAEDQDLVGGHKAGLFATLRKDRWWWEPLWTGTGFLLFTIYANFVAFQGEHYVFENYLSPFYSPVLFTDLSREGAAPLAYAWFGEWPLWLKNIWPPGLPSSPAWLILAGPMVFRATCYYYRKFYYRAYFLSPPACAVGGLPQKSYRGETGLFIVHNLHRYTWYIAVAYIVILYHDAYLGLWRDGELGFGVGTAILFINPTLLAGYTFGCHSCRHLSGGHVDSFSVAGLRHKFWSAVSVLNGKHMAWAWVSMIFVGLTDFYIRMCSMGYFHDFSTWN